MAEVFPGRVKTTWKMHPPDDFYDMDVGCGLMIHLGAVITAQLAENVPDGAEAVMQLAHSHLHRHTRLIVSETSLTRSSLSLQCTNLDSASVLIA